MPIVSRQDAWCGGPAKLIVTYSAKDRTFSAKLPERVAEKIGRPEVHGRTQKEVEDSFFTAGKEYKERLTSRRKILAYKVKMNVEIKRPGGTWLQRKDISFADHMDVMGIGWTILTETECDGEKRYEREGRRFGEVFHKSEWTIIDWTEEREAFFRDATEAFKKLMIRIDGFFADEKAVLAVIDSGTKLLA